VGGVDGRIFGREHVGILPARRGFGDGRGRGMGRGRGGVGGGVIIEEQL